MRSVKRQCRCRYDDEARVKLSRSREAGRNLYQAVSRGNVVIVWKMMDMVVYWEALMAPRLWRWAGRECGGEWRSAIWIRQMGHGYRLSFRQTTPTAGRGP